MVHTSDKTSIYFTFQFSIFSLLYNPDALVFDQHFFGVNNLGKGKELQFTSPSLSDLIFSIKLVYIPWP